VAAPVLIAHRLGRAYGPDSSRLALSRTLAGGVEAVETDVCLTADDELVVLHDPLLSLGTTLSGWAHERTATEIRAAHLRDRQGQVVGERPMLLAELLDLLPEGLLVQLEVKAHADRELAARTARVICQRCRRERPRLEVISFHSSACATAAAHGYFSRLVVWTDNSPAELAAWARRRGVGGVSVEHFLLSGHLARVLRLAGLSVNTGTINEIELARRAIALAAPDAICTDRPLELQAELDALAEPVAPRGAAAASRRPPAHPDRRLVGVGARGSKGLPAHGSRLDV
jgi:glycerophosphoryl diester phosphodiesterase